MSVEQRSQRVDVIRGVSILLVLFHHFVIAYRLDDTTLARIVGSDAIRAVARNGNYGVTMFFAVSGFLITSNASRRWGSLRRVQPRSFYGLRVARILPCLVLLMIAVDVLALAGFRLFQNGPSQAAPMEQVPYWLSHLAALTSWMNVLIGQVGWFNYPLGVLWSLSIEEAFYFSFPLACVLLRGEARLAAFWAAFVVLGPVWRLTHQGDEGGWLYSYLGCFDGIAIGCCTALLAEKVSLRGTTARVLEAAVVVGMASLYLARPIAETNILGVSLMGVGTGFLLLGSRSNRGETAAVSRGRMGVVRWFGRLSYELYLFHLVVLGGMRIVWPARAVAGNDKLFLLVAYLATSALLAFIVAIFYSEPLNKMLRRPLAAMPVSTSATTATQ